MKEYNATVEVHKSNNESKIFRVFPDFPFRLFLPGQYGSLGLTSDEKENTLVKRAYSISSSMIDLKSKKLKTQKKLKYLEFYINKVEKRKKKEQITPKLFNLKSGDRIFCGEKIVGNYHLTSGEFWENVLLISSHTGESPNNSITNELLLSKTPSNIININVGDIGESLYTSEHRTLEKFYNNYEFIQLKDDTLNYSKTIDFIKNIDGNFGVKSKDDLLLNPNKTLVMICGDPILIGEPIKKGGWDYEYPEYGLINLLEEKDFVYSTRFKKGNVICESYW